MTPPVDTPRPPSSPAVDPFAELPGPVVLRLLAGPGKFSRSDYAQYCRTNHWEIVKAEAYRIYARYCVLCDSPAAQVHHRPSGYRHLFAEDPRLHLIPLCRNCHRLHHRK